MASYVVMHMLGLYPVPGTRQFLLSSPFFPKVSIYNPLFKKTTTISTTGFQGNPAPGATGNVFVKSKSTHPSELTYTDMLISFSQGVTIDGKPWKSTCYLDWDVFSLGSSVVLELSNDPNLPCGTGNEALPPSLSTGGF